MKIKIARDILLSSLQKVNNIISSRSTLPILGNVLLQAKNNKLILTSTDLDIRIKTELEADITEEGETTLPGRKFFEIIRELYGEEVNLENKDNHISIKCGKSNFKLLGLSAEDFPIPLEGDTIRSFSLDQLELSKILNLISYSVNQDDTRKALNGILLSVNENNFTSVATDGRRLALVEKNIDSLGSDGDVIVPVKSANELNKLLGKSGIVRIDIGENLITFVLDDSTIMTTKLIDENYPNYKQVIPISFSREIVVPREEFAATLKRVSLVVSERNFYVKVAFMKNRLELSAVSTDIGESKDSIEIEYDGAETIISFNPRFLLDPLLKVDSDSVKIKMNDGYSPIALSNDDGFLYVIMPMRNR